MPTMQATVFRGVNDIRVEDVILPTAGVGEAVIKIARRQSAALIFIS